MFSEILRISALLCYVHTRCDFHDKLIKIVTGVKTILFTLL